VNPGPCGDAGGLLCTRCGSEPRIPRQRWGRHCFAEYRRLQRRRAQGVERVEQRATQNGVEVEIRNPAYLVRFLVGYEVLATMKGAVIRALTPEDGKTLQDLARRHSAWVREVPR
jgi:hypothetical protein